VSIYELGHTPHAVDILQDTYSGNDARTRRSKALKNIAKEMRELGMLHQRLKDAVAIAAAIGKRGRRSGILHFTINKLNAILVHYTGKKLVRGTKENTYGPAAFAAEVLKLADGQIPNPAGVVSNLIKNYVTTWDGELMAIVKERLEAHRIRFTRQSD